MLPARPSHNAVSHRSVPFFYTLSSLLLLSISAWAVQPDRITGPVDNGQTVVLKGSVHPKAQPQYDRGKVQPSMKLPFITLLIQPSADQQAALKQLLAEQQDPSSPNYHKWLTPEQFGQRFGLSNADVARITHWLRSQGFSIVQVAHGRDWIAFSGTVAQVQRTLHTELHRYYVDGEERFANATEPSVPKALEGIVAGFRGLNNFHLHPLSIKKSDSTKPSPDYFNGGNNLAPGDIATIYDIGPLYTAGIDGTAMKIAIMGQTDIYPVDIAQFRAGFGLPANVPQQILATGCTDPGFTGDLAEADIDLEWSGAVARNATIIFVKCDTTTNNGVITSAQYAIDNDVAPVISMSYGGCESVNGQGNALAFQRLVQKANSEGITFFASSGDSGAAECDSAGSSTAIKGLAVNLPASIPEVTAVGGTEFNEGSGIYWGTINSTNGGSALSYIPELAWDDNSTGTGFDTRLSATGGGASIYFPKPSWQTGPGVPNNNFRYVPDVAMAASADHDGYIVCTNNGSCAGGVQHGLIFGGTSVATPVFAGLVALLNQQLKNAPPAGLGNINTSLYQFAQSVPSAFHDVPAGNYNNGGASNPSGNMVPCKLGTTSCPASPPFQFGFLSGTGYDQVTGLGSVDANVFVTSWGAAVKTPTSTTVTLSPASVNVGANGPVMAKATVTHSTGTGTPTGSVNFYVDGSTTAVGTGTLSTGSYTFDYNPSTLAAGNHPITARYSGDSTFAASTSPAATLGVQDFNITAVPTTVTVSRPGQSGTATLTITPLGGFNQTISYTCTGLPSGASCTAPSSATSTTLTIATAAPSARLDNVPLARSRWRFYAILLPGWLGLVVSARSRKRTRRGIRLLSFIAALVLSTLWMPACGGGSSTPRNPGTPTGTSNVTVMASTGGATPLMHTATITLTVQ
jgi:subtilase family serine protease